MATDSADTPTVPGGATPAPETKTEQLNDWARIEWQNGNSYYILVDPQTGQEERFIRVTSPLEPVAKTALIPWAGGLAAKAAYGELPRLVASMLLRECGRTYHRCEHDYMVKCDGCPCLNCQVCMMRFLADRHLAETYRRSDEGTRFHRFVNGWIQTGHWPQHDPDLAPYVATFRRFVDDYDLTPESFEWSECIVVNRAHGYAGTCDAGMWVRRNPEKPATVDLLDRLTGEGMPRVEEALVMGDWKTREAEGRRPFRDMALQLAGYCHAEWMRMPDGSELPMPSVNATAVLQIRPDGHDVILTLCGEPEFQGFLGFLQGHRWELDRGAAAISARTFKYAPSVAKARARDGAQRRAAEKKAALSVSPPSAVDVPEGSSDVDGAGLGQVRDRRQERIRSILGVPSETLEFDPPPF
jgi:hypothetical protein